MTRMVALAVIVILCIPMASTPARASEFELDDDLWLDFHPGSLKLRPYEEGRIVLYFRNAREEAVTVFVEQDESNNTSASVVAIAPELLEVGPGRSGTVSITVGSRANFFRQSGDSGVIITISWGPDLTVDNRSVDLSTVEDSNGYYLTVDDELFVSNPYYRTSFIVVVSAFVASIVYGIFRLRRRRGAGTVQEPTEPRGGIP